MTLRANFQSSYLWRYLIMSIAGLFMAGWFAYDGLVAYPKKLAYAQAFEEIKSEVNDPRQLALRWQELADSKGWPVKQPEKPSSAIRNDIYGQYIFGVLSLFLGVPAAWFYFRSRNRWVEATDEGLQTSWGQQMRFAEVTLLNKKRWDAKGIARAFYTAAGKKHVFVFDDFKYQREPLGQILRRLEAVLQPDQIVGGISEAQRDLQKQGKAPEADQSEADQADANS